ncbi:MAG: enoyl-CoA hydratase-related protein [Planctomycetota bacterium]
MTDQPLTIIEDDGIVIIELEQPGRPVVVLDHALVRRLDAAITALPRGVQGVMLASASERAFVAGADLSSIRDLPDDRLHAYLEDAARVFGRLAGLPCPTAAAINGAALGGGLELAMHCDGLVAAPSASGKDYPIGLPEAGLSICPGWGGTNLLPARVEPGEAIRRTASGEPFSFSEARDAGLFDAVIDNPAELRAGASAWLRRQPKPNRDQQGGAPSRWIGAIPSVVSGAVPGAVPGASGGATNGAGVLAALDAVRADLPATDAAAAVADCVDAGLANGWAAALRLERERLVHLRHTDAGKTAIAAFFEKSAKR